MGLSEKDRALILPDDPIKAYYYIRKELISGVIKDLEKALQYDNFNPNYKQRLKDLLNNYEAMIK